MIGISNFLKNALDKAQSQQITHTVVENLSKKPETFLSDTPEFVTKHHELTIEHLVTKCHGLRYGKRRLLDLLLEWHERYKGDIFLCYAKMADKCRFTPRHAKRLMKELVDDGLVTKQSRSYDTNIYRVHKLFDNSTVRSTLGFILPAIFKLSLSLLLSSNTSTLQVQKNNVTPSLYNESYKRTIDSLSISKVGNATTQVTPNAISLQKQRREEMSIKRRSAAKRIKSLKLTQVGLVFTSCFPVAAQIFADDCLFNSKKAISNPEAFFYSMLFAYCKANRIRPDWTDMFLLKQLYGPKPFTLPRVVENKAIRKIDSDPVQTIEPTPKASPIAPAFVRPKQGPLAIYKPLPRTEIPNKGTEITKAAAQATPEQLKNLNRWLPSAKLAEDVKKDYDEGKGIPVVTAAQIGLVPDELDRLADKEGF